MQYKILLIFILMFPAIGFAQEFRPLLDPTAACSYGNPDNPVDIKTNKSKLVDYFYIVEVMPKPEMSVTNIENLLQKKVLINEKEFSEKGNIVFQCIVDCEGKAGDYQLIECPSDLENAGRGVLKVFKNDITSWEAGKQRNVNVDVLMKINIRIDNGKIRVVSI